MHAGKLWMKVAVLCGILGANCALAQTRASCEAYLATDPSPTGIPAVSGSGIAQRSELLAAGGKLVAIGTRYYSVSIPAAFYTAATPVLVLDLHGTGGYSEAEWADWHTAMADKGVAFIALSWGGGTAGAATDTEIYSHIKQIVKDVGASCPIASASKWLMGFSVGSAMSFAVMIRDVADQKLLRGQIAISGAAIGPLTTGKDVMHSTVEASRSNAYAVWGIQSWMYCGEVDYDHGWSMCTEMPNGVAFVNEHGGRASLYRDASGSHHSLPANVSARNSMFDFVTTSSKFSVVTAAQTDCMLTWLELGFPAYVAPSPAASLMAPPYRYRYYSATRSYLGTSSDDGHLYFVGGTPATVLDLGLATAWLTPTGCK